jgi:hypothetical protein
MVQTEANFREYQLQAIDDEIKSLEGSIRALRSRRNTLAPVSSLPTEVLTAIFALLHEPVASSPLTLPEEEPDHLQWIRVAHVCHHWREIALNQPLFWSHVDFATFTSAGAAEILARANMVPLSLEARVPIGLWDDTRFSAFQNELQAHVSHTRHLDISAEPLHLRKTLEGLITPAPRLEYLSLSSEEINNRSTETRVFIPDNIFGGATPRLSGLVLRNCKLSWKSPLLRGLKHLDIRSPFDRPGLSAWLDMLIEMPQLITLTLHEATPVLPHDASLSSDFERIVTLPSVVRLDLSTSAESCGLALAHLNLPALTQLCLRLTINYFSAADACDLRKILPFVSRHAHTLQHTQPLQSMLVRSDDAGIDMFAWTAPDMVIESINLVSFPNTEVSAPLVFSFTGGYGIWTYIDVFDAAMATLPLDSLVTLISQSSISALQKEVWFHHAPRWPLLQCVRLSPSAGRGFTEMLLEDNGGRESPLLPSLTKLILVDTDLSPRRTFRLCDALMKRVEQGAPLETLDLHTCVATSRAVDLLSQIVVDVLGPEKTVDEREEMIYMWHSAARGLIEYGYASSENDRERDYDNPDSDEEVRANVDSDAKIWDNEHTDDSEDDDAWYLWK